ncbi:hypothetical protein AW27_003860 [Streptomyces sp. PCS3-D2]|uniref:hypothetical protein n=1 Tax=Streptomyces sp. PCS3-D2 TaxID=1460244 RepID=UPI0004510F8D|nr:hypothetical protein [Streptomyces sp. PCS3-D2]WKV70729.1 hypothetical protein AW27_003860 [Streptomyces sp. PCS3-D2]
MTDGPALLCWLVLNAFATAPVDTLTWEAPYDLGRIVCLLAAACSGTVLARLSHARSAYHRVTPQPPGPRQPAPSRAVTTPPPSGAGAGPG